MATTFSIESSVRGYHIYKDIWEAAEGEMLHCTRENSNSHDPFAVAIVKNGLSGTRTIVGHVPRKFSAICSLFLRRSGSTITCRIIGSRRYSVDLPQGGLEIPCMLTFSGQSERISKTKALIAEVTAENKKDKTDSAVTTDEPPAKRPALSRERVWARIGDIALCMNDKEKILGNTLLNDNHM